MASNAVALKKKAAEFEQKKLFDKALALYRQVLDDDDGDEDVSLYNRVGDMYLKSGQVGDAMEMFERAVDRYDDQGLYNNAIALCNKILRQSPGRISVYYKLGKVAAKKGFKSDAKANFLEYAGRKQKDGDLNEAFRALKEFADLCPDQDDIRLMLADQLTKEGRKDEALEQLQILFDRYTGEGNTAAANATADRMRAIDPSVEPATSSGPAKHRKSSDLIFLDLDDSATGPRKATPLGSAIVPPKVVPPPAAPAPAPLELLDPAAMVGGQLADEIKVERRPTGDLPLLSLTPPPPRIVPPPAAPVLPPPPPEPEPPAPLVLEDVADTEVGSVLAEYGDSLGVPVERITGEQPVIEAPDATDGAFEFLDLAEEVAAAPAEPAPVAPGQDGLPEDFFADDVPAKVDAAPTMAASLDERPAIADDVPTIVDDVPAIVDDVPAIIDDIPAPLDLSSLEPTQSDNPFDLPFITDEGGVTVSPADAASSRPTMARPLFDEPSADEASALLDAAFPLDGMLQPEIPAPELLDGAALIDTPSDATASIEPPSEASAAPAAAEASELLADEPPRRRTSVSLARNVVSLRARLDREPENWDLVRTYGEALLDDGERDAGLSALETAMAGYEKSDDLISARSVAEEIVRLVPNSIKHQQKRVEYCFRGGDRAGLVDAYVDLADALLRDGQTDKARSVYGRVLELAPGEIRAETALQSFVAPAAPAAAPAPEKAKDKAREAARYTGTLETPLSTPAAPPTPAPAPADDDFIDLGDLLRDDEPVKNTRMVVEEKEPTGDEDADFQDMLRKFKQGVAENVEEEDYDSHYDLGVAFKEMGLLDEAIGEFQKALRGTHHRIRTHEALGQCFIEKAMWPVAATILQKATMEPTMDDAQLIGVLYLLGQAYEELQRPADALAAYQRVYAVDIGFRDVAQRVMSLSAGRR